MYDTRITFLSIWWNEVNLKVGERAVGEIEVSYMWGLFHMCCFNDGGDAFYSFVHISYSRSMIPGLH